MSAGELRRDEERGLWVCDACGLSDAAPFRHTCPGESIAKLLKQRTKKPRRAIAPPRSETQQALDDVEELRQTHRLTLKGKILSCLPPPGDAAATLTKYTGVSALAELWERISGQPCGCADRQAWMNAAWQLFVWQHFSQPVG